MKKKIEVLIKGSIMPKYGGYLVTIEIDSDTKQWLADSHNQALEQMYNFIKRYDRNRTKSRTSS